VTSATQVRGRPGEGEAERAPAVRVEGVSRRFGSVQAVDDVSFSIPAGEIHALLGPNGAGKTTLLRMITGLVSPTAGRIELVGLDVAVERRRVLPLVGVVPASARTFYMRVSGLENLIFFARLHGLGRGAALARSRALLEQVGLADAATRRVGVYSSGMQKRLAVARALLTEPEVLLVDEATADLDPQGALDVRALFREQADRGAAVLWTTQRIEEIRDLANQVTVLRKGRVRFAGTVPALLAQASPGGHMLTLRPRSRPIDVAELNAAVGELGVLEHTSEDEHYVLVLAPGAVLGDALARILGADVELLACRAVGLELEDAFLALTQETEG
jgi:ABC-2 type transport system ATP-binding protein